ncbi:hypothetical protein [Orenia marismortui]|uniref:hypothetical protein n=1 Tax=Orenia marismortui TaxID=46469 RepID=UPI00036A0755|nr:hypothetical protein [Orenia marismortui]
MSKKELLLRRLNQIGKSLESTGEALALLGLGSVGKELDRLDEYSDLDFFVIAKEGSKMRFIDDLDWLTSISPVAYHFQNTDDGYKLLYKDGIYCEFAVFEEKELAEIDFAEGRIVWKEEGFDESICSPQDKDIRWKPQSKDWAIGEALTCLYVGLTRFARGEKLSATRFIQSYALDNMLSLSNFITDEVDYYKDKYQNERRYEKRYPEIAKELSDMVQGYDRCPESAIAIVEFMDDNFEINQAMKQVIINLATELKADN